jgi:ketosteroid isomerase-like protein
MKITAHFLYRRYRPMLFSKSGFLLLIFSVAFTTTSADDFTERDEVLALVTRQLESWASGDEECFRGTLHPEVTFAYPGKRLDMDGVLQVFREWKDAFTDTSFVFHRMLVDGNHFAIEYRFSSTRVSTGARQSVGTVAIGEIRDGKILVIKEYLDGRVSRMQETGDLPIDEENPPFPWPDTPESRIP